MFSSLKKIFKKEKVEERAKEMTYTQIMHYYNENIERKKEGIINEAVLAKDSISSLLKELVNIIEILKGREIIEKRAKTSEVIKNKFCMKAENIVSSIDSESFKLADVKDIEKYHDYIKQGVSKIDLSPKEVMHIKFFFSEDFSEIARKINEINKNLEKINTVLNSPFSLQKKSIEHTFDKIQMYEKNMEKWKNTLEELSKDITELEKSRNSISFINLAEFSSAINEIAAVNAKISYLKQQIDSEFGGLSKILKRIYYKEPDHFIQKYIDSPYEAYLEDSENKIRSLLLKIIIMIKDEKIDADKRIANKLELVIERLDGLDKCREEIIELQKKKDGLKKSEELFHEKEIENRKYKKNIEEIGDKIACCKENEQTIKSKIANAKKDIESAKKDISEKISFIFNEKIELLN